MKLLVTGSGGFIGRHFVDRLSLGNVGLYIDLKPAFGSPLDALDVFRADTIWGNGAYDLVVHCAARSPHRAAIDGDPGMHPYNVMLDAAMFDWAIRTRQTRILYFSSCAAADGPVDGYAATKLTGEWLAGEARKAGVGVTVVRPYSGYGEDQSEDFPFRALLERARRREDPFQIWGDGQQVRDWIHVDDVVGGALAVVESGTTAPVSLCTGVGTSMVELAQLACKAVGYEPEFEFRLDKPAGVSKRIGDLTELRKVYRPAVSLADGVKRALGVAACR